MPSNFLAKDMRKLRLDRYTPSVANEARSFVEECLGESLPPGDLLEALKDGIALCKLVNRVAPGTLRFQTKSTMPFVQMENISLFIEACKTPPFDLLSHDIFLTVDLYESKDPAQVLQCLAAFSRAAHKIDPVRFPNPIGVRSNTIPQAIGASTSSIHKNQERNTSSSNKCSPIFNPDTRPILIPNRTGDSNKRELSPGKASPNILSPGVSSWSNKSDQGVTSPAWNIVQYGYLGGASQGKLGVSFGGRRQITSAGPYVSSMTEKEKKKKKMEVETDKMQLEAEESERRQKEEKSAVEKQNRAIEEKRVEDAKKLRESERLKAEEENRRWEEEELRWRLEEKKRHTEELEAEARLKEELSGLVSAGKSRWRGQLASHFPVKNRAFNKSSSPERDRIKELEGKLEQARARELKYERERQAKLSAGNFQSAKDRDLATHGSEIGKNRALASSCPKASSFPDKDDARGEDKQEYRSSSSRWSFSESSSEPFSKLSTSPTTESVLLPTKSLRPLPESTPPSRLLKQRTGPRPLPDPAEYVTALHKFQNRSDNFLTSSSESQASNTSGSDVASTLASTCDSECDAEDASVQQRKIQPQAGGWIVNCFMEKQMEMERQRQREWEESQREPKKKVLTGNSSVDEIGGGLGGRWDVSQWTGYTGGDSQNRSAQGIGSGKRQIAGPRPLPCWR